MQVIFPQYFVHTTDSINGKEQKSTLQFLFAKFNINTGATIPIDDQIKHSNFCQVQTLYVVARHEWRCGVFRYLKGWFS